ncbi:uncharacterized protein METZ01_LOCUS344726, partial [marine metagenome]
MERCVLSPVGSDNHWLRLDSYRVIPDRSSQKGASAPRYQHSSSHSSP